MFGASIILLLGAPLPVVAFESPVDSPCKGHPALVGSAGNGTPAIKLWPVVAECSDGAQEVVRVGIAVLVVDDLALGVEHADEHVLGVQIAVVFGNTATLAAFSICILRGLVRRSEPAVHKRMMAIASANITVQAGTRVGELFGLSPFALGLPTLIVLLLAVVVHDLVTLRRVHPATIWGCTAAIACPVMFAILGSSPLGESIVEILRSRHTGA